MKQLMPVFSPCAEQEQVNAVGGFRVHCDRAVRCSQAAVHHIVVRHDEQHHYDTVEFKV